MDDVVYGIRWDSIGPMRMGSECGKGNILNRHFMPFPTFSPGEYSLAIALSSLEFSGEGVAEAA
jgi:hypothetical protein